jgi:hypothetical protein
MAFSIKYTEGVRPGKNLQMLKRSAEEMYDASAAVLTKRSAEEMYYYFNEV